MRILILGGFLGSGKTTVLMELADYLVRKGKQVAILENEISTTAIDNQMIARRGFPVRTISAGCICCASSGVLLEDVHLVRREYGPDWLIIEATGMAYPDAIQNSLYQELGQRPLVLTLVDASRWKRVLAAMRQFAVSQLQGAGAVLVTKIDTVEEETVREVICSVREYTDNIPVRPICAIEPIPDAVWEWFA